MILAASAARGRRLLEEAPRALLGELADVAVGELGDVDAHRRHAGAHLGDLLGVQSCPNRCRLWTLRELVTIEVPMWPGMTTEHLMCGAFMRRSVCSASVKPFTANLAAL